jgi:hypothetical protein
MKVHCIENMTPKEQQTNRAARAQPLVMPRKGSSKYNSVLLMYLIVALSSRGFND